MPLMAGAHRKMRGNVQGLGWIMPIILILVFISGWYLPPGANLIGVFLAITAFMAVLGMYWYHSPLGILIDERNVMSLSRLQSVLWTVVVVGSYLVIVLERVKTGGIAEPLNIEIDWTLWTLMGISTASLVASPFILNNKKNKEPSSSNQVQAAALSLGITAEELKQTCEGILYKKSAPEHADFMDIFQGDELADMAHLDIAKVQMFIFTMIAAISYAILQYHILITTEPGNIVSLPVLSEGFLTILGISHAGYLTSKTINVTSCCRKSGQIKSA